MLRASSETRNSTALAMSLASLAPPAVRACASGDATLPNRRPSPAAVYRRATRRGGRVHPNITEQLRGIRQILGDVVAPEVSAPYPSDILGAVLGQLEMLERSWYLVLPFLLRDNAAMERLLSDAVTSVEPELASRIRSVLAEAPPEMTDVEAVDARNERLRGLLADAVSGLASAGASPGGDACAAALRAHLRARLAGFPLASTATLPSGR